MIIPGDRVRLVRHVALRLVRREPRNRSFNKRGKNVDWVNRQGTVLCVSPRNAVRVVWDGRKSPDEWPVEAMEVVT